MVFPHTPDTLLFLSFDGLRGSASSHCLCWHSSIELAKSSSALHLFSGRVRMRVFNVHAVCLKVSLYIRQGRQSMELGDINPPFDEHVLSQPRSSTNKHACGSKLCQLLRLQSQSIFRGEHYSHLIACFLFLECSICSMWTPPLPRECFSPRTYFPTLTHCIYTNSSSWRLLSTRRRPMSAIARQFAPSVPCQLHRPRLCLRPHPRSQHSALQSGTKSHKPFTA